MDVCGGGLRKSAVMGSWSSMSNNSHSRASSSGGGGFEDILWLWEGR